MKISELKDEESVLLSIIGALLCNESISLNVKQFLDSSANSSLKDNEVILESKSKKFKISVQEL